MGAAASSSSDNSAPQHSPASSVDAELSWDEVLIELSLAAEQMDYASVLCEPGERATDNRDVSFLLGDAWDLALKLVVADVLALGDEPCVPDELVPAFGRAAPVQVLAEVCCLLPAAVTRVMSCPEVDCPGVALTHASELLRKLLGPSVQSPDRLEAVCAAMGLMGTAALPRHLQGVLQQRCKQLYTETSVLHGLRDDDVLTFSAHAEVPFVAGWLEEQKELRLDLVTAALTSTIIAAFEVAELCAQQRSVRWAEPRLVVQHAALMDSLLATGEHEPIRFTFFDVEVEHVLDKSCSEAWPAEAPVDEPAGALGDVPAGPCGDDPPAELSRMERCNLIIGLQQQYWGHSSSARTRAAMEAYELELEQALMPVAVKSSVPDDPSFREDTVMTNVCAALRAGALVVKTCETQLPFMVRPSWPAALALAVMDWFLLPTSSARLQRWVASSLMRGDSPQWARHPGELLLSHSLVLLPAAVAHIKMLERGLVGSEAYLGAEDATSVCRRMLSEMLPAAMDADVRDETYHVGVLLQDVGFNPAAVAAAVAASEELDYASAVARLLEGQPISELDDECMVSMVFHSMYEEHSGELDAQRAMMARPILMSMAVFLALLLDLADSEGWYLDPADTSNSKNTGHPLPPWFWSDVAALYTDCSVFLLPGGDAAAAVLEVALRQAQHDALQRWRNGKYISETPLLDVHYEFACAQLSQSGDGCTQSSNSFATWEHALADAAEPPTLVDYGGDEHWRENSDLHEALLNDVLPWDVGTISMPGFSEPEKESAGDGESGSGSGSGVTDEEECDERQGSSSSSDSDSYSTTATAGGSYAEEADAAVGSQEEYADDFDVPDASAELAESPADDDASVEQRAADAAAQRAAAEGPWGSEPAPGLGWAGLCDNQEGGMYWKWPPAEAAVYGSLGGFAGPAGAWERNGPSYAEIRKMRRAQGWGAPQVPLYSAPGGTDWTDASASETSESVSHTVMLPPLRLAVIRVGCADGSTAKHSEGHEAHLALATLWAALIVSCVTQRRAVAVDQLHPVPAAGCVPPASWLCCTAHLHGSCCCMEAAWKHVTLQHGSAQHCLGAMQPIDPPLARHLNVLPWPCRWRRSRGGSSSSRRS
jgi:hypothetical protein